MTSRRSYWRDVAIGSSVVTLCFEQPTKTTLKSNYYFENKGVGEKYQSLYSGRDTLQKQQGGHFHMRVVLLRTPCVLGILRYIHRIRTSR